MRVAKLLALGGRGPSLFCLFEGANGNMFHKLRSQMKWIIIAVAIAFAATLLYVGGSSFLGQAPTAQAVAKVNGDSISEFELHQAYINYVNYSNQMGQPIGRMQEEEVRFSALQDLVDQRLMLQAAKRERIKASESEVKEQLNEIKQSLGENYSTVLRQQGLNERSLQDLIRESLVLTAVQDAKSAVDITDNEVLRAYEEEHERREVRHILVEAQLVDGVRDYESALATAEQLYERLLAGEDFGELAAEHSDDPGSQDEGGSLGIIGRMDPLVPEFLERTFSLSVGEVSEPVRTQYGYHLIEVTEVTMEESEPFDEIKEDYRNFLEQRKGMEAFDAWIESEREQAEVSVFDPQLRAYQLARAGRLDQAIEQYRQAIEERPNDAYLLFRLATVLDEVGAEDEALDMYREAANQGLTDPFLWFVAGSAYQDAGRDEEAKDAYMNASEFSPGDPQLHQLLSFAFDELGLSELAEAELETAEKLQEEMIERLMQQQMLEQESMPDSNFLDHEQRLMEQIESPGGDDNVEDDTISYDDEDESTGTGQPVIEDESEEGGDELR